MPTAATPVPAFGLYLHIPYCRALCHYCDFAKTANFDGVVSNSYLEQLARHTAAWLADPEARARLGPGLSSVFLGGGTPSLFAAEYEALFRILTPVLAPGCEVTLEANPDDITDAALSCWRQLGITRLSVGVQTFAPEGLAFLRRTHGSSAATAAIGLAREQFPNLNVDLIYGWQGQDLAGWKRDLACALALGVQHLSLYTLTYEPRTPIGRAALRGRLSMADDDNLAAMYGAARTSLGEAGFLHEEISNWSRPGASCRHNWLYWRGQSYLGVGSGAHGYLADAAGPGQRYAYGSNDRRFLAHHPLAEGTWTERFGVDVEGDRTMDLWLTETVATSLRTCEGVPLTSALARSGHGWTPTPLVVEALDQGIITIELNGRLTLAPAEWFRETAWAVELLRSCVAPGRSP